jgi:hypothetical protein
MAVFLCLQVAMPVAFANKDRIADWDGVTLRSRINEFTISEGRHSGTGLEEIHEDGSETFTPLDSLGKREP